MDAPVDRKIAELEVPDAVPAAQVPSMTVREGLFNDVIPSQ
jgi:hypothetical protein